MSRFRVAGLALALWACGGNAARGESMSETMKPAAEIAFQAGPAILPAAAMLAWLEREGAASTRPRLKVPVVVRFGDVHRLEIGDAWIGVDTGGPAPENAVHLELDDTGLGIALIDTARKLCPAGQPGCGLELIGVWGRVVELPIPLPAVPGPKRWPFGILRVLGAMPAGTTAKSAHLGVAR